MAPPSSPSILPPDCLRSFDRARRAEPLKRWETSLIASRILGNLLNAGGRTIQVLESAGSFPVAEAQEIYSDCLRSGFFTNRWIDEFDYERSLSEFRNLFSEAEEILSDRLHTYPDIPLGGLFSARAGMAFIDSLEGSNHPARGHLYELYKTNPFLILNVAIEILQNVDYVLEERKQRTYFWDETTDLYRRMKNYSHEIRSIYPADLNVQDMSQAQILDALAETANINAMIVRSGETKYYSQAEYPCEKQMLSIVQKYIEPMMPKTIAPVSEQKSGSLLPWDEWADRVKSLHEHRLARRAAHPELFFPDRPFIR